MLITNYYLFTSAITPMNYQKRDKMRGRRFTDSSDDALNDAIAKISATFMISTSIHTIAKTVLDCAIDITESEYGIISFYDGEECCVFCNDFRINEIGERILSESTPFFDNSPKFVSKGAEEIRNILSVPAEMGNTKLGHIVLLNSTREYSSCDMKAVKQLSELLALAVNRKVAEGDISSKKSLPDKNSEICRTGCLFFKYNEN
jgi:hypothetical protein